MAATDTGIETVVILDEDVPAPVTLSGEVARLCAIGQRDAAMIAMAQAIERLAVAVAAAPSPDIAPRVEAVLRDWGYVPLTDLPTDPLPDELTPRAPLP